MILYEQGNYSERSGINQKIIHQTVGFTGKTANLEQIGRELTESLSVKATT